MPSKAPAATHIFEDPADSTTARKSHRRVPSVGDVLRGRRKKEETFHEFHTDNLKREMVQNPLMERHLNSPPPPRRVPVKDGEPRPAMHKKTGSSVSLKSFMKSKEKSADIRSLSSSDGRDEKHKPKKTKSSTNLSGLLRKRSKKDLKPEADALSSRKENVPPASPTKVAPTPIWAQFATQPVTDSAGKTHYPQAQGRSIEDEIRLYTPRDYSEFRPAEQRNFHGQTPSPTEPLPPQRPFLEHKTSRSSIFKENIDDDDLQPSLEHSKRICGARSRATSPNPKETKPQLTTQTSNSSQTSELNTKRTSRVMDVVSTFNLRSRKEQPNTANHLSQADSPLSPQELDSTFERVLDSLNIPQNMRDNMRSLKPDVKFGLIKGERIGSGSSTTSISADLGEVRASARSTTKERPKSRDEKDKDDKRSRSRSRPRSRILTMGRRDDGSPTKKDKTEPSTRSRSKSKPRSIDTTYSSKNLAASASTASLVTPDSATTPGDFTHYLHEVQKPELVEVGKLHKLRILLRNESVSWTDTFVSRGGMDELVQLLYRIMKLEWREDHEDALLHEVLLCLKALCTTSLALQRLAVIEDEFFPALLGMLFDEERKGPSEFATRAIFPALLFAHLAAAQHGDPQDLQKRASKILNFLRDPSPEEEKQPLGFISQMHVSRPYRVWCKEVNNVTKEVFWIFLHHMNVIPVVGPTQDPDETSFAKTYFPAPRPPHPAAPYVGGVEWEATQYLATHLDLLNGLIASTPSKDERNALREDLRQSGWEKVMGGYLRTCKEKFYGSVHDGLKVWVSAARADGWAVEDVRAGPPRETSSPRKIPTRKKVEEAPKLDLNIGAATPVEEAWA